MPLYSRVFFVCLINVCFAAQVLAAQYRYDFTGAISTVALYNGTEEQLLQQAGVARGSEISFSLLVDYDTVPENFSSRYSYASLSLGTFSTRDSVVTADNSWSVERESLYSVQLLAARTEGSLIPGLVDNSLGWGRQVADGSGESQEATVIAKADYVQQLIDNGITITPALQAQIDALPDPIVFAPDANTEGELFSEMVISGETALHLEREDFDISVLSLDDFLLTPHQHWQTGDVRFSILSVYFGSIRANLYGSVSLSNVTEVDTAAVPLPPSALFFAVALMGLAGSRQRHARK